MFGPSPVSRNVPQPLMKQPKGGIKNSSMENLKNTQAQTLHKLPKGKAHSKVSTAPKNLPHGKYI